MKNLLVAAVISASLIGCAATAPGMSDNDAGFKLAKAGQYSQAEPYFDRALAANPNNPYALTNLGNIYEMSGRYSQSREMYQRLLKLPPNATPTVEYEFNAPNKDPNEDGTNSFRDIATKNLASMKDKVDRTDMAYVR